MEPRLKTSKKKNNKDQENLLKKINDLELVVKDQKKEQERREE